MRIVAGLFKNRVLVTPKGNFTRPSAEKLRGAFFNICQNYIENARFLDLYAGSGAMGLEALSRGAESAYFIDSHRECIRSIHKNIDALQVQNRSRVFLGDVLAIGKKLELQGMQFDLIFADPPYNQGEGQRILDWIDKSPLLAPGGALFIEEGKENPLLNKSLSSLEFVDSRKMGSISLLYQFNLKTAVSRFNQAKTRELGE